MVVKKEQSHFILSAAWYDLLSVVIIHIQTKISSSTPNPQMQKILHNCSSLDQWDYTGER